MNCRAKNVYGVNSWRGGQWKLFVGSAVLKVASRSAEWYYWDLVNGSNVLWFRTAEDLADAAVRLVRPPQSEETLALLERLAAGARELAERRLTLRAMREYTESSVRCMTTTFDHHADWRMRL